LDGFGRLMQVARHDRRRQQSDGFEQEQVANELGFC
jgi:hypothetical protein